MYRALDNLPRLEWLLRYRAWLVVGFTIAIIFGIRLRLRAMPLERDEGEYAYAGQLILRGIAPYKEAYNMKLPGTYAMYALIMAVFGQTPSGIHIGLALIDAASIVLIFLVGRKLIGLAAGLTAAVVFGLLSTSPSVLGLAAHATHFVVLPALAGMLLLLRESRDESKVQSPKSKVGKKLQPSTFNLQLFMSGLLFGLAFLMKQQGVFFGLFGLMYVAFRRLYEPVAFKEKIEAAKKKKSKVSGPSSFAKSASDDKRSKVEPDELQMTRQAVGSREDQSLVTWAATVPLNPWTAKVPPIAWGQMMKELAVFGGGLVLPYVLVCLFLWWVGAFHQFAFWTITYAKEYASAIPLVNATGLLKGALNAAIGPNTLLWLLSCAGLGMIWWDERLTGNDRFFLAALLVCSGASTAVGFYFRGHYFITLLPALALLAGAAVSRGLRLIAHDKTIELFLALPVFGLLIFGIIMSLIGDGAYWLSDPADAVRMTYHSTLFNEAVPAGNFIKTNCPANSRIAVLGSEPEIYFYSHQKSATGYIYTYPLMESHPFAKRMQSEMIGEIEQRKPEYMVYVDDPYSWLQTADSEKLIFEWWKGYWASNMDLVKTFEFLDEPPQGPTNTHQILLLKRRETTNKH
jgi:hypothetical protein